MVLGRARGLVIDGPCNSACAWAFVQNENACFTARASFGFHAAHDPGTGRRLAAATGYWLGTVGPELRTRLAGLRTSSSVIRVSAKEMRRYYGERVCGARTPTTESAQEKSPVKLPAKPATQVAAHWSAADVEAGIEAMRVAREGNRVTNAALTFGNGAAEATAAGQDEARPSPVDAFVSVLQHWEHQ
jgi:hypothetical protein